MSDPGRETVLGADPGGAAAVVLRRLVGPRGNPDALGWATVDLDRAGAEFVDAIDEYELVIRAVPDEPLLGARCRLVTFGQAKAVILLEPATEGAIAASLARFGEGYVATWIRVAATRFDDLVERARGEGLRFSAEAMGPIGRERLVVGGPRWGPHVLVAELAPASPSPEAATIER